MHQPIKKRETEWLIVRGAHPRESFPRFRSGVAGSSDTLWVPALSRKLSPQALQPVGSTMARKMQDRNLPELLDENLNRDPILQFQDWFREAREAAVPDAEAMTLATVSSDGKPSARVVLMKRVDGRGFVFFTNYESRKGRELDSNPAAALLFYWEKLGRQVRVEGKVGRIPAEESDLYFASRPRENQLSSLASSQSRPVERHALDREFEELARTYAGKPIPRPGYWGGYCLKPTRMEFWQRRFARLNDRILYEMSAEGTWTKKRLAP